jgi:hypothetical protein
MDGITALVIALDSISTIENILYASVIAVYH